MADGPEDAPGDDGGGPDEGPILSPEELDIADDEHVEQLDEDRYVVSADVREGADTGSKSTEPTSQPPKPDPDPSGRTETELSEAAVHDWLRESFASGSSRYGFDVTATFDGSVSQRRMASNDVVTIFESLILWYAQQIDRDTPVEEILGILLMESNVPVRYPPESLKRLLEETGLGPDDDIAALVAAVEDHDGVEL